MTLRERLMATLMERPASAYLWSAESLDDDPNAEEYSALALQESAKRVADAVLDALGLEQVGWAWKYNEDWARENGVPNRWRAHFRDERPSMACAVPVYRLGSEP